MKGLTVKRYNDANIDMHQIEMLLYRTRCRINNDKSLINGIYRIYVYSNSSRYYTNFYYVTTKDKIEQLDKKYAAKSLDKYTHINDTLLFI